jgi:hypothetical protein
MPPLNTNVSPPMPFDFQKLRDSARKQRANPLLPDAAMRDAEVALGFPIPAPLRRLYSEVGNGGFGPGYGFYGLASGTEQFPDENVVYLYTLFRKGDPEDHSFSWPHMLLPVLDWGCAIRSCVDCSTPWLPIIRHDPNVEVPVQFQAEDWHLEEWLQAWLDGYDLYKNE